MVRRRRARERVDSLRREELEENLYSELSRRREAGEEVVEEELYTEGGTEEVRIGRFKLFHLSCAQIYQARGGSSKMRILNSLPPGCVLFVPR